LTTDVVGWKDVRLVKKIVLQYSPNVSAGVLWETGYLGNYFFENCPHPSPNLHLASSEQ